MSANNPIIIALDLEDASQARVLIRRLGESVSFYKVGLELFTAGGMPFVRELIADGLSVFVDLKLYDIGETVKRTVARVSDSGAHMLTIHGMGAVMRAALAGRTNADLKLLAVTVLTSFDQQDLTENGYQCGVPDLVDLRARNAAALGIDGIICAPTDAARVRSIVGPNRLIVTPGVRSRTADTGDQKRIATPADAIRHGADYLVIGRQVTRAPEPAAEVQRILEEIAAVPAART